MNSGFIACLIGQTLLAIGQPFIYNMPAKLSAVWFPPEERLFSTMIGVNTSILGSLVGFYLPVLAVTEDVPADDAKIDRFEIAARRK